MTSSPAPDVSVVVLTHERPRELAALLPRLLALPERPRLIVVDNASRGDGLGELPRRHPQVQWVRCARNLGAAGRNAGVAQVRTPFVAFCDDDTCWAPGALARAAQLLHAHPRIGVLSARVLVGPRADEDPACARMQRSPLPAEALPGPALVAFMAGACVMRTEAYRAAGGYEPRLFLGAEEWLMALDLLARGWRIVYACEVVTHHHPSAAGRDPVGRRIAVARNSLWIACMRLPPILMLRLCARTLARSARHGLLAPVLRQALPGLRWALGRRACVPREVSRQVAQVMAGAGPAASDDIL